MNIRLFGAAKTLAAVALVVLGSTACNDKNVRPDGSSALVTGYTCCNFHYNGDWINDVNYASLPMIPAGTPISVTGYGSYRASVMIDNKPFRLGLDYGRTAETMDQWIAKMIVSSDPKAKIATYSANVQKAIQNGQIMVGMTKEQVINSVGHPLTNENPRLDAPLWRYWWSAFGEYQVYWNGDRVSKVTGHPETLALILAPGSAGASAAAAQPASSQTTAPASSTKSTTTKRRSSSSSTAK